MINIALMGAGRIGKMHAKNIALHPMCNLSYVYDINKEFANQVAQSTKAKVAKSPDEAINDINFNPFASPWRLKNKTIITTLATLDEAAEDAQQEKYETVNVNFPIDLKEASQEYEIKLIKDALKQSQFNQKKTADLLKLTYHQLRGYLKKYQLLE